MSIHEERNLDQCAGYAVGALDGTDLKEFEAHLADGCVICRQELDVLSETASLLPAALPGVTVPQELKDRIMFSVKLAKVAKADVEERTKKLVEQLPIAEGPITRSRKGLPWLAIGLTLAAILLVIGTAAFINTLFNTIARQQEFLSSQQNQIESIADQLENRNALLKILESPRMATVLLNGQGSNTSSHGKLLWDLDGKTLLLHVAGLAPAGPDRIYQIWMIVDGRPTNAGSFSITNERDRQGFFTAVKGVPDEPGRVSGVVITLEPRGGSSQPTGETLLSGNVGAQPK